MLTRVAHFARRPLTWLVVAEVVVLGALGFLTWRVLTTPARPATVALLPAPGAQPADVPALPELPSVAPVLPSRGLPWPVDFADLNHDAAALEVAEAAAVKGLAGALRLYLDRVVLPPIRHAESDTRAISPAMMQSAAAARKIP